MHLLYKILNTYGKFDSTTMFSSDSEEANLAIIDDIVDVDRIATEDHVDFDLKCLDVVPEEPVIMDRPSFASLNLGVTSGGSHVIDESGLFMTSTFRIGYYPEGTLTNIEGVDYYADVDGIITWQVILPLGESYTYTANIDNFPHQTGYVSVGSSFLE